MTVEALKRQAAEAERNYNRLDQDADEAEDEVWRARAEGDAELEGRWQARADERRAAADRAYDRMTEAEGLVADAEWEAEYPEEAAAERAAAPERRRQQNELFGTLLRDGVITQELYERLVGTAQRM